MADAPGPPPVPAAPLPFNRILVTGADGFVGSHLLPALRARLRPGARLVVGGRSRRAGPDGVPLDLGDPAGVAAAVAAVAPDLVVHLAGQASVGVSLGRAGATWAVNLGGSLALARALAVDAPGCTLLFASSTEVYGRTFLQGTATEAAAPRPQGAYARSKFAAELMLADVLPAAARLIVARPCNHSGPGQGEDYVVPAFAAQIARAECGLQSAIRVGNLQAERHFLDVQDVVAAYLLLLANADALPRRALFNIASAAPVAVATVLDRLRAISGVAAPVEADPARLRPSETARAAVDASALRAATGWAPRHPLDETLAAVLADQRARLGAPTPG